MRKPDIGERSWPAMWGRRRSWRYGQVHPKVTRWAQEEYESSNLPFFIKVIGTTSSSPHRKVIHGTKLQRVPAAFAREYSEQMDNEVSLEDAVDGSIWKVSFRVPDAFPVWSHGWPAFALHYNLQPGHNLVLVLVAHSRFRFTLFNDHGSQIIPHSAHYSRRPQLVLSFPLSRKRKVEASYPHICIHMGISCALHQPKRRAVDQSAPTVQENSSAHESPPLFLRSKQREVTNVERRAAKKAASRYGRSLSNPNSMTVLTLAHVSNNFDGMELPRSLLSGGAAAMSSLTLIDATGRSWEMQWTARGRHRLALHPEDWVLFAVQHFLKEGDACVFETLDLKALTILVRIFRVVPILDNTCIDDVYTH